jgi:hypothetical protein
MGEEKPKPKKFDEKKKQEKKQEKTTKSKPKPRILGLEKPKFTPKGKPKK